MSEHHHDALEQQLEKSLIQAVNDTAYRTLFYRDLMASTVYILADGNSGAEWGEQLTNMLDIQHWQMQDGLSTIPFFSSLEKLQQATDQLDTPFVAIPVRDLFELTRGAQLFLNPKCEYGKAFYPKEIAMLLKTGGISQPVEQQIEGGITLTLGVPDPYPSTMIDALTALFSQRAYVRSAYLALCQDKMQDEEPNFLIGLELEGQADQYQILIQEAGTLACDSNLDDEPVDLYILSHDEQDKLSHLLLKHSQPFYQRRWGSWLRNAIPGVDQA